MTRWQTFKTSLMRSSGWLAPFLVPLNDLILTRLRSVEISSPPPFDPQLTDLLLNDISALLDRALLYRRDANDLEILATNHAVDYQYFIDTHDKDVELSVRTLSEEQSKVQSTANDKAMEAFSEAAPTNNLAAGLAAQAGGVSKAASLTATNDHMRRRLIEEKGLRQRQYQDDLQIRHTTPGNALNFGERYERVTALLLEDIEDAYVKAICASAGLHSVFCLDIPVPPLESSSYLDALVSWARTALRELGKLVYSETEFDYVISPITGDPSTGATQLSTSQFKNLMQLDGPAELVIAITDQFAHFKYVRVRSIGLSFGFDLPSDLPTRDYRRLYHWRAAVRPPKQKSPLHIGGYYRSPIVFGYVSSSYGDTVAVEAGLSAKNIDPKGDWRISVERFVYNPDAKVIHRRDSYIGDMRLHLRLSGLSSDR